MSSAVRGTPEGIPSRMAIRPFPWDSPPFRYRSMRETSFGYSLTIVGVTKTNRSVWLTDTPSFLNSQPRKGIRLNHGTPWVESLRVSSKIPPITVVSPSRRRISVVASFLSSVGPAVTVMAPMAFLVTLISRRTVLAWGITCGVTFRVSVASTNVVCVPCSEVVAKGTCWPCSSLAGLLSNVMILGAEMILVWPRASPADSRRSSCPDVPKNFPMMSPIVLPGIDLDLASWAETDFRDVDGLRRIAVIEVDDARHELFGFQRRFFCLGGVIPEPGDVGQGVDPQDVPFADLPQVVQLEYEVECLIPRHVQQFQRHLRLDRFPDDHVETADVGDQAEHAADLCVLEVQGNTLPGESLGAAEPANIGRLIRFRLGQRRQRIEEFEPFRHRHRHAAPWAHARDVRRGREPITRCIRRSNGYPRPSRTHLGRARNGTSYRLCSLRSLHC